MDPAYRLYGGTIEVEGVLTIENRTGHQVTHLPFYLYRLLHVDAVESAEGQALAFTQQVVPLSDRPLQQVNAFVVSLPAPLAEGASCTIRVKYQGAICGYPEVMPYVQDHVSSEYTLLRTDSLWFPILGEPARGWPGYSFDFDLSVVSPAHLAVVASGRPIGDVEHPSGVCHRWQGADPYGRLTVACADFRQEAIAADVSLFYLARDRNGAQVVARALNRARELGEAWFGPLPAHGLNIVEIPEGWGSEASGQLILQTADTFQTTDPNDVQAYRRALSWAGHELIHLWNAPSAEEHVSRFLDEGITHYVEALLLGEELGREAYWQRMESYRSFFLSGGEEACSVPLAEAGRHMQVREEVSRGKGPWAVAVLHRLIGERLLPSLNTFFARYRDSGATIADWQSVVESESGVDLSRFFQEWFWEPTSSRYLVGEADGPALVEMLVARYLGAN